MYFWLNEIEIATLRFYFMIPINQNSMNFIKTMFSIGSCLLFSQMHGQFTDEINTNRPGNSAGAFSVGKKVLQLESGFYLSHENHKLIGYNANGFGIDLTARYGLWKEQFEVNLDLQYQSDTYVTDFFSKQRNGLRQTTLGAKYLVYDPFKKADEKPNIYSWRANHKFRWKRLIPAVSAYAGLNYTMNNEYSIDGESPFSPKIVVIAQQHIVPGLVVVTNLVADKIASKTFNYGYVVTATYGLNDKWSAFVENRGIKGDYYSDGIFTAGATYLLKNNLQLDASISKNIKNTPDLLYGGLGVSWRLDKKHEDKPIKEGKETKEQKKARKAKSKSGVLSEEELQKAAEKAEKKRIKNQKNNPVEEVKPVEEKKKRVDDLDSGN